MIMHFRRFRGLSVALLTAGAVAACAQVPSSPQAVQATNPTVTYNYRTDQELVNANQNATTFCSQYQTTPRTANVTSNSDGTKTVLFECVRTTAAAPAPAPTPVPNPNVLSYSYRTDQELVQASQTASAYCAQNGALPMTSRVSTNVDGSRTVTFQCAR